MRNLPAILARRKCILINLEIFKALITAHEVILFEPTNPHVQQLVPVLQGEFLSILYFSLHATLLLIS